MQRKSPVEAAAKTYSIAELRKKHPRAYMAWTDDEDAALRFFEQGSTVRELAEMHQRQRGGIRSRLRRLGLIE
jgi:hypothetical protein